GDAGRDEPDVHRFLHHDLVVGVADGDVEGVVRNSDARLADVRVGRHARAGGRKRNPYGRDRDNAQILHDALSIAISATTSVTSSWSNPPLDPVNRRRVATTRSANAAGVSRRSAAASAVRRSSPKKSSPAGVSVTPSV